MDLFHLDRKIMMKRWITSMQQRKKTLDKQMIGEIYLYVDGVKIDRKKAFKIFESIESFNLPKSLYFQATQLLNLTGRRHI